MVGSSSEADVHLPEAWTPPVAARHALLERVGSTYRLRTEPGASVRVNGEEVTSRVLEAGDLVELGRGGPIVRFRFLRGRHSPHKSLAEALADCVDCSRYGSDTPWGRFAILLSSMPRELLSHTAPRARTAILIGLAILVGGTAFLSIRTATLERRLAAEAARLRAVAELLEETERVRLTPEDLQTIREGLEARLRERVEALEARGEAVSAVIAGASRSVVFLQGGYGFLDPASGDALRTARGPDGRPLRDRRGNPVVVSGGDGPILEMLFTGTAFIASERGLLLTNRHVVRPWEFDEAARDAVARGLVPVMRRLVGFLPGEPEPFPVEPLLASATADLAVLRSPAAAHSAPPLPLATGPARPGQEVVVLGYPTGVRALLARTNPQFVDGILRDTVPDFWSVALRLAQAGYIAPLATRGIVGQATESMVVYDAETTRGGSGGPVLGLDGTVLAVTVGILPEFGGSNLGVPVEEAHRLLEEAWAGSAGAEAGTGLLREPDGSRAETAAETAEPTTAPLPPPPRTPRVRGP